MTVPIAFTRARIDELLWAMDQGDPVAPRGTEWTQEDLLLAAGALLVAARRHAELAAPNRAAQDDKFMMELWRAVDFYAMVTQSVVDGHYSELFEDVVACTLDGETGNVVALKGFKRPKEE